MKKSTHSIHIVLLSLSFFLVVGTAFAADLNWDADTNVTIGGNTYVILNGSEATTFEVTATTAVLTVPAASMFTFKSNDRFVLNNNGSVAQTCAVSSNSLIINGPKTITITPDPNTTCSSGGGGSGSITSSRSVSPTPVPPSIPTDPTTPDCLPTYLFSPATGEPCPAPVTPGLPVNPTVPPAPPAVPCPITLVLKQGSRGQETKCLQTILGGLVADGIFGPKTKAAVILFQKNHPPLVPDGIVGPKTKAELFK